MLKGKSKCCLKALPLQVSTTTRRGFNEQLAEPFILGNEELGRPCSDRCLILCFLSNSNSQLLYPTKTICILYRMKTLLGHGLRQLIATTVRCFHSHARKLYHCFLGFLSVFIFTKGHFVDSSVERMTPPQPMVQSLLFPTSLRKKRLRILQRDVGLDKQY
jgi:hypothetical protein